MARLARLIFVASGIAFAIWLLPASVHIVDWTADGPMRVALLAPPWKLSVALAIATVAVAAVVITATGSASHRYQLLLSGTVLSPLALLWLWLIPYLPWIPDRAPALLVLAGPLRWGVVALALCGSGTAIIAGWTRGPAATMWLPGRRTVFAVSLALYLFFGLWSASAVGPGADEPHYLVITQSLLRDHDLAIENNHARGDYHEYFNGELRPDFLRRGIDEVIYSIHAPGLPALLVPVYAAAGYKGAVGMLCLLGALAALAVFDLASLVAGPAAALTAWAAVCLTVPFVPHSWLIFPEIPGALLVAWGALWLFAPLPARASTWLRRGAALAVLPWLHTKFVILLAAMVAALFLRLWRTPRAAAALVTPAIISVALWLASFYYLYGAFDPQIPYGDFPKLYVLFSNIPRGLLGLLFDQKFGLLMYAPAYLAAVAGLWMMLRRQDLRLVALALLATVAAFVTSSTRMYMWWGGSSAPARFLVPILPLLAPMIAIAFQSLRPAGRTACALLLAVSVAVAAAGVIAPERFMLFSAPHGFANMADAMQGAAPLAYLLPTFTEGEVREPLALLAPWAIAALLALVVVALAARLKDRSTGFAAAAAGLVTFAIGGAVLAGAPAAPAQRRATALRGRLDLMRAVDGSSLRGLDYARRVRLNERQVTAMTGVNLSRAAGELIDDPPRLAGPFNLSAGRFEATIAFDGTTTIGGTALVILGEGLPIAHGDVIAGRETRLTFSLPVDSDVWVAVSDPALAKSAVQVGLTADSIVPLHDRPRVNVHAIEPAGGRSDAYIIYADGDTYPEGGVFWTRGARAGTVFVAPAGASTLTLTLHVGPVGGPVRVTVDGNDRSVTMSPGQTRDVDVPLPPGARLIPILVQASGEFRPSDHEPGSTDRRWLGCQVRVGLR